MYVFHCVTFQKCSHALYSDDKALYAPTSVWEVKSFFARIWTNYNFSQIPMLFLIWDFKVPVTRLVFYTDLVARILKIFILRVF